MARQREVSTQTTRIQILALLFIGCVTSTSLSLSVLISKMGIKVSSGLWGLEILDLKYQQCQMQSTYSRNGRLWVLILLSPVLLPNTLFCILDYSHKKLLDFQRTGYNGHCFIFDISLHCKALLISGEMATAGEGIKITNTERRKRNW